MDNATVVLWLRAHYGNVMGEGVAIVVLALIDASLIGNNATDDVFLRLGVRRDAFGYFVQRSGLPGVGDWTQLSRALQAVRAIRASRTTADAAEALGYSMASAVCRLCAKAFSATPAQIRTTPGYAWLLDRWVELNPADQSPRRPNQRTSCLDSVLSA